MLSDEYNINYLYKIYIFNYRVIIKLTHTPAYWYLKIQVRMLLKLMNFKYEIVYYI